jgi:hypothetical protein
MHTSQASLNRRTNSAFISCVLRHAFLLAREYASIGLITA